MDDFLREIQTSLFREWINNQKRDYYHLHQSETDPDAIIIENEYCYSYVTFNPQCIIELCVMNKRTDEMAFYLHFQFKTLKHAISLFEEMAQCIKKMIDQPICRLLLCCSGGMTTAFFADKIKNGIKVLNLNMEVAATFYQKIYNVAQNYDVILLAPQVSYVKLQVEKVFKNKLVLKIPTQIFASYNVGALITFIEESLKHKENKYNGYVEPLASMMEIKTNKNVLAVSSNANGENSHISYRLYNSHQDIVLDSNIIKSNIKLQDVLDALDTVVLQNEMIDVISIALPGVMVEGNVYSGIIEGGNHQLKERLEKEHQKLNDYIKKNDCKNFKAKLITCPKCESKINKKYILRNMCPLCKHDLRSKTVIETTQRYQNNIQKLSDEICQENLKQKEKLPVRYLVGYCEHIG